MKLERPQGSFYENTVAFKVDQAPASYKKTPCHDDFVETTATQPLYFIPLSY